MAKLRTTIAAAGALVASLAAVTITASTATAAVPHKGTIGLVIGGDAKHPIALVHGAINAAGKDDPNHSNFDVLTFGGGSFRVVHPDSQSTFVPKVDKKTCFATFTITGRFTISHGTGRFAGIAGSGTYAAQGDAFLPRTKSGACNMNAEPLHEIFTVHAHGTLK